MDYFLKADSEAALMTALEAAGAVKSIEIKNETGEVIETRFVPADGYNLDIIGTVYVPTGNMILKNSGDQETPATYEVPEMVALSGFHANLRGPADLAPKVTYTEYMPTDAEKMDTSFIMPEPTKVEIPGPIDSLLVYPKNPVRVWA